MNVLHKLVPLLFFRKPVSDKVFERNLQEALQLSLKDSDKSCHQLPSKEKGIEIVELDGNVSHFTINF